jgi:hypothetical protein
VFLARKISSSLATYQKYTADTRSEGEVQVIWSNRTSSTRFVPQIAKVPDNELKGKVARGSKTRKVAFQALKTSVKKALRFYGDYQLPEPHRRLPFGQYRTRRLHAQCRQAADLARTSTGVRVYCSNDRRDRGNWSGPGRRVLDSVLQI